MIAIAKSPAPPASLARAAPAARQALEQAYDADPAGCQQPGTAALKPQRGIYAARDVKQQVRADQHQKCAYCETCFVHSSPGDVEHYRPKAGYRQTATGCVQGPGYYWLAYDWQNLLFACEDCNRARKRQLFPLANDPTGRARTHHDSLAQEAPLLVNPATVDPAAHLTFAEEVAKALTPEGRATIAACALNRVALLADRRERLRHLRNEEVLARIFEADPPLMTLEQLVRLYGSAEELSRQIVAARLAYQRATHDAAEYAGMARANFKPLPTV
jgi:uncharacterized protein (TIGR02646 family)